MNNVEKYLLCLLINGKSTGYGVQIVIRERTSDDGEAIYNIVDITKEIKELLTEELLWK